MRLRIAIPALFAGALATPAALACSCIDDYDPVAEADLIFEGELVDSEYAEPCSSPEPWWMSPCRLLDRKTTFAVTDVFKGAPGDRVTVNHTIYGNSCGIAFRTGRQLVFAHVRDGRISTSYCTQRPAYEPHILDEMRMRRAERTRDRERPPTPLDAPAAP